VVEYFSRLLQVGDRVGNFEVEALIARGGMAVVYRARDPGLRRPVALKVIAPELAQDQKFRQRFTQESQLAASIDHPNIIPIYAAGEENHLLYLVMRYVQGGNLGSALKANVGLTPDEALPIFTQVAGALDAAHAHDLIHRDVKPGNILLSGSGDLSTRHVYLSDFGLTKRLSSDPGVTTAGHFLGTIQYVAPEQVASGHPDRRADIYSLGCVIYEALAGQPPFVREDQAALLYAHVAEPPPRISERRPDLPLELDDVFQRVMAKDPRDRHQDCRSLIADLYAAFGIPVAPMVAASDPGSDPGFSMPTISTLPQDHPSAPDADSGGSQHQYAPSSPSTISSPGVSFFRPAPAPDTGAYDSDPRPPEPAASKVRWIVPLVIGLLVIATATALLWPRLGTATTSPSVTEPTAPQAPTPTKGSPSTTPTESPSASQQPIRLPQSAKPLGEDVLVWRRQIREKQWVIETFDLVKKSGTTLITGKENKAVVLTPDRRTILYLREQSGRFTLRAQAADGREDRALFSDGTKACPVLSRPAIRADGQLVVVCRATRKNPRGNLLVMTLGGQVVRTLDKGWVGGPTISRDGEVVIYWNSPRPTEEGGALYRVPVDGSEEPVRLLAGRAGEFGNLVWSPTTNTLAFRRARGEIYQIGISDIRGGRLDTPKYLTFGEHDEGPSWSPDGSRIAFRRGTEHDADLIVMDADGTTQRQVLHNTGYAATPIWTGR
jgi:serine/threonine protein kinase